MKRILIIQLRQMGDVLMTTPVARQLRQRFPLAQIDVLTERAGAAVYRHNPNRTNVFEVPRKMSFWELGKLFFTIRKKRYDLVVDCFSNPKSAQMTFFSGAPKRFGFELRGRRYAYTATVPVQKDEYSAVSKLRLLEPLGVNLDDWKIEMPVDEQARTYGETFAAAHDFGDNTIAFCAVSRRSHKIWNPQFMAGAADWLADKGYRLWFVYGPGEKELAAQVYDAMRNRSAAIMEYDIPDLFQLRAILEKCRAYVGNDGGNKHLAICAGIPTVTVFGVVNWKEWTPPNSQTDYAVYRQSDSLSGNTDPADPYCGLTDADLVACLKNIF